MKHKPCVFITSHGIRPWGRVFLVPVLKSDKKLLLLRFIERNFDALNLQLQRLRQPSCLRSSPRSVYDLQKGTEPRKSIINVGGWRAIRRIPAPALLEEPPHRINNTVGAPLRYFPSLYLEQRTFVAALGVWCSPRQDLEN